MDLSAPSARSSRRSGTSSARRAASPSTTCSAVRAAIASACTPTAGQNGPPLPTSTRGRAGHRRPRLYGAEVRSVHQPLAHAHRARRAKTLAVARARRARGGRSERRDPDRGTPPARRPTRPYASRNGSSPSSPSGTRSRIDAEDLAVWPKPSAASRCRSSRAKRCIASRSSRCVRPARRRHLEPDVCNCGGILALKEIAAMAEPWHVTVSPHNYNSTTVGLASTLQVSACIPNFLITEYFVNFEAVGREIAGRPFRSRGEPYRAADRARDRARSRRGRPRAASIPRGPAAPHPPARGTSSPPGGPHLVGHGGRELRLIVFDPVLAS